MAACEACTKSIEKSRGKLVVKEAARAVSERDDRLLAEKMEALENANKEVGVKVVWEGIGGEGPLLTPNRSLGYGRMCGGGGGAEGICLGIGGGDAGQGSPRRVGGARLRADG